MADRLCGHPSVLRVPLRFDAVASFEAEAGENPMSRAFINEDAAPDEEPRYDLPPHGSPHYAEAAAWALLQGANVGHSRSAELATGYAWGDARLVPHIRRILEEAEERTERRVVQLARRFLRQAQAL